MSNKKKVAKKFRACNNIATRLKSKAICSHNAHTYNHIQSLATGNGARPVPSTARVQHTATERVLHYAPKRCVGLTMCVRVVVVRTRVCMLVRVGRAGRQRWTEKVERATCESTRLSEMAGVNRQYY